MTPRKISGVSARPRQIASRPSASRCTGAPATARVSTAPQTTDIDKGEKPFITAWGTNTNPVWSPDGSKIAFVTSRTNHSFIGMYDVATRTNLTEQRLRKLNRIALDVLPLELAIKKVKGKGERRLIVFSDADCPFCHKLEEEMKGLDNVTIYTFLFPIDQLHPQAAQKSRQIWCSADPTKAWDEYFVSGKVPDNKGECKNPVAATQALGTKLRIQATPTMILADGSVLPGALPLARLEAEMVKAEAEAKKPAEKTAKK